MRKAVIMSLDACFREDVPHFQGYLKWLMENSAVCTRVKTVYPALTYPAHTTLITGCDPKEHGIGHNQPHQHGIPAEKRAWYWDAADVKRESLFTAVKRAGGQCASVLWPVTGKHPHVKWNFPEVLALPGESQVLKMLQYGTWPWVLSTELRLGRQRASTKEPHLSDYGEVLCRDVIRHHRPDLTALHMVDVDEMRHLHGVWSPEALAGLARMEARVERIHRELLTHMPDALLIVVSDHGQADVTRDVCLTDVLKTAGLGDLVRVQSSGMTAYLYAGPGGPEGLARVEAWLRANLPQAGASMVHTRCELDAMGAADGPALGVTAAEGVVFSDYLPSAKREKATHGFAPGHPAEDCLMMVHGRGIRKGEVESMPMRDVAPTIAALMGVEMHTCSGISHAADMMK